MTVAKQHPEFLAGGIEALAAPTSNARAGFRLPALLPSILAQPSLSVGVAMENPFEDVDGNYTHLSPSFSLSFASFLLPFWRLSTPFLFLHRVPSAGCWPGPTGYYLQDTIFQI